MKAAGVFLFATIVSFYTAFVLMNLWNWFGAPALNVGPISYWQMVGLNWLVAALLERDTFQEDKRWERAMQMMQASLPEGVKADILEEFKNDNEYALFEAGWRVGTRVLTNTLTLGLGWLVYSLTTPY